MNTYSVHTPALTVIRTDKNGEKFDLNAEGEPCETVAELRQFIIDLHEDGAYDDEVRDDLLAELG